MLVGERRAAGVLDLKPAEFRQLVDDGHLPRPYPCGGFERWDADELIRIWKGEAMDGMGDIAW